MPITCGTCGKQKPEKGSVPFIGTNNETLYTCRDCRLAQQNQPAMSFGIAVNKIQHVHNPTTTFWSDDYTGMALGGFYFRNPLSEHVARLESMGWRVVGIKFDGSKNIELICEEDGLDPDDHDDE